MLPAPGTRTPHEPWLPDNARQLDADPDTDPQWPDDYSPKEPTVWPDDWTREQIEAQCKRSITQYVDDWGWELHKYARLNNEVRFRKTLRYEIHLDGFHGHGKQKEVLDWQDPEFRQCAMYWTAFHGRADWTRELLELGASPDVTDVDNWTPISIAAYAGPRARSRARSGARARARACAQAEHSPADTAWSTSGGRATVAARARFGTRAIPRGPVSRLSSRCGTSPSPAAALGSGSPTTPR
jgi:hypothetical protein